MYTRTSLNITLFLGVQCAVEASWMLVLVEC